LSKENNFESDMTNGEKRLMKEIEQMTDDGYHPSRLAKEFVNTLGPDRAVNGLKNNFIEIKRMNEKKFDIVLTDTYKDTVMDGMAKKLEDFHTEDAPNGYRFTARGEKHIRSYFTKPTVFGLKTIIVLQGFLPNGTKAWDE
tara:strand:- start:446 stop:868 length:423 start_codon:yes stop_codon:yes gene_type:complete